MEIIDQQIREELASRIQSDPTALSYVNQSHCQGCLVVTAIGAAFIAGLACGTWLFR